MQNVVTNQTNVPQEGSSSLSRILRFRLFWLVLLLWLTSIGSLFAVVSWADESTSIGLLAIFLLAPFIALFPLFFRRQSIRTKLVALVITAPLSYILAVGLTTDGGLAIGAAYYFLSLWIGVQGGGVYIGQVLGSLIDDSFYGSVVEFVGMLIGYGVEIILFAVGLVRPARIPRKILLYSLLAALIFATLAISGCVQSGPPRF